MEFDLNEDQKIFQESIRQILEANGDLALTRKYTEGDCTLLDHIWDELAKLGYMSIAIPEKYGGLGLGPLTLVPILEEMGRVVLPGPYPETVGFAAPIIEAYGTDEQKNVYLPKIAEGKQKFSLAFVEPGGEFLPSDIQFKAEVSGGAYILTGVKTLVPHADFVDTLIVPVRTNGTDGEDGITILMVDCHDEKVHVETLVSMDETRKVARVTFDHVVVSREQQLGNRDEGWEVLQSGFDYLNAAWCSTMVGGMDQIVKTMTEYSNTREQFGQPIGRFQAIKHKIVDILLELESARSLSYYAAWALETKSEEKDEAICQARSFINEAFIRAANQNIQIHGGMGFTWEFDCHFFLKRAMALENYLGRVEAYQEKIINLLTKEKQVNISVS